MIDDDIKNIYKREESSGKYLDFVILISLATQMILFVMIQNECGKKI